MPVQRSASGDGAQELFPAPSRWCFKNTPRFFNPLNLQLCEFPARAADRAPIN